jgi:hypothetical protein
MLEVSVCRDTRVDRSPKKLKAEIRIAEMRRKKERPPPAQGQPNCPAVVPSSRESAGSSFNGRIVEESELEKLYRVTEK